MEYKIMVHDEVGRRTVVIDASDFEQAAKRYFAEFTTPHYTDQWGVQHWEVSVVGVKFHKTYSQESGVSINRVTPQPVIMKHIKMIAPAWILEEQ